MSKKITNKNERFNQSKRRRKEKYAFTFDRENDFKYYYIPDIERAERLKEFLSALYEINKRIPIIVEGRRDVIALRKLGFIGEIKTVHSGEGLYEFSQNIVERYNRVVLLIDWDEKGEILFKKLSSHLKGLWEEFSTFREIIKMLCQKDIMDIEDIPNLLKRLVGTDVRFIDSDSIEL